MKNDTQISCPNCGTLIDVNDILKHQLENSIRQEYQAKELYAKKELEEKEDELAKEKSAFEDIKKKETEKFQDLLESKLKVALKAKEVKLKSKLEEENSEQLAELNKELQEQSDKLKDFNKNIAEIARLKREKEEAESKAKADAEIALNEKLKEEAIKIKKIVNEANELKFKEYEKQLSDQKELMDQMKRKHEQGSMQMQGEVQELAIEEWLANTFPLDTIDEIKKGARGADCIQIVNTRESQNCGTIYYESKRTKDFQPSWIEKFKNDIREKGSNIGVLVTEVLPKDMDRMGLKEGIWICTFEEFKGLSNVLRQTIIKVSNAIVSQENKGDKMAMLYDYFTSNEFKLQMEGIVESFNQMAEDLEYEKNAMTRIWNKREKQILKVKLNTIGIHGSLTGIAGKAIQEIKSLELPEANDE
ncbi:MAG: DUF2130 domain-containing protein [Flavobacteriaceae bacterium]|nr:DUF2130 domain-containing protein [Flavobacteriaceae bacterium]